MKNPKVFISYSWSSHQHEQWVINLAKELRQAGVDVILDKWDLKEGHDAIAFMEKMVTDPEIKKVIIVSDRVYAQKADSRKGGVGTETQIISKEIYDKVEQNKFVVVIAEKDENGKPYLPTYYKSRIYIDLSEPDSYAENFERLLRWIYDKPLYKKPELGNPPSFLSEGEQLSLGTTVSFKRAIDAIKDGRSYSYGALDEYLETFTKNLEKFRIKDYEGEFDEAVIKNIEAFLPYRNEFIKFLLTIARYDLREEFIERLHRFFESLIPYMFRPEGVNSWREWDFDNFKFIIHELFLYAVAILIKLERFQQAAMLLSQRYYVPGNSDYGRDVMVSFTIFRQYMASLEYRKKRLNLRRLSLRADLLKERSQTTGIAFKYLTQADFVLFIRAGLHGERWWPETLLYLVNFQGSFEIFVRAESKRYFEKIKCLFDIDDPNDLKLLLEEYNQCRRQLPTWQFESFNPSLLSNIERLATIP
ncbi:MAG: TIR domain-containing protein [Candidatus Marinimicrobia bacterium]|nr:TIR domain-containing protein [Candidatus Neomarinimicrobiota bacterium]